MMRSKLRLRFAIPVFIALLSAGLLITPAPGPLGPRMAVATTPSATPTFPPILPFSPMVTSRILPVNPIPNRVNNASPIPVGTSTPVTVIVADPNRHDYMIYFDSTTTGTKVRCTFGDVYGDAPGNTPSSTVGAEITSTLPMFSEIGATANVVCVSETGAVVLDTIEE